MSNGHTFWPWTTLFFLPILNIGLYLLFMNPSLLRHFPKVRNITICNFLNFSFFGKIPILSQISCLQRIRVFLTSLIKVFLYKLEAIVHWTSSYFINKKFSGFVLFTLSHRLRIFLALMSIFWGRWVNLLWIFDWVSGLACLHWIMITKLKTLIS